MKHSETELHLFDSVIGSHLFVVDGSRIYDVPPEFVARLEQSWSGLDLFSLDSFPRYSVSQIDEIQ